MSRQLSSPPERCCSIPRFPMAPPPVPFHFAGSTEDVLRRAAGQILSLPHGPAGAPGALTLAESSTQHSSQFEALELHYHVEAGGPEGAALEAAVEEAVRAAAAAHGASSCGLGCGCECELPAVCDFGLGGCELCGILCGCSLLVQFGRVRAVGVGVVWLQVLWVQVGLGWGWGWGWVEKGGLQVFTSSAWN